MNLKLILNHHNLYLPFVYLFYLVLRKEYVFFKSSIIELLERELIKVLILVSSSKISVNRLLVVLNPISLFIFCCILSNAELNSENKVKPAGLNLKSFLSSKCFNAILPSNTANWLKIPFIALSG